MLRKIVKDDTYNRMSTITGYVEILNNRELGRTAASCISRSSETVVRTVWWVHADAKGDYSIRVGRGRYKLIVYNPSPPTYDMIAPGQDRYVEASPRLQDTRFDIKLVVPSDR